MLLVASFVLAIVIEFWIFDEDAAIWTSYGIKLVIRSPLGGVNIGFPHIFRANCLFFKAQWASIEC